MKFLDLSKKEIKENPEIDSIIEKEEILYTISEFIIKYREENEITQTELAEKLKVNQSMIAKLESGNYNATFNMIHEISRKLSNSSEIFIKILENMIKAVKNVTEKSYINENKPSQYIYSQKNNVVQFQKYSNKNIKIGEKNYGEYQSEISAIG